MRGAAFYRAKRGRRDSNHAAIRDGLRALGHFVVDTAGVGDGVPDLCVYPRNGPTVRAVWLELKVGRGKERASQFHWRGHAEARGIRVATVRTLDEALEALR